MEGIYRLGCILKKLLRSKFIQGHLRASGATNFIKQRNMQFLLNFLRLEKFNMQNRPILKENLLIILILKFAVSMS